MPGDSWIDLLILNCQDIFPKEISSSLPNKVSVTSSI